MNIIFLKKNLNLAKKKAWNRIQHLHYFDFWLDFLDLLIFFSFNFRKRLLKEGLLQDKLD